jgi:hypothetical protein
VLRDDDDRRGVVRRTIEAGVPAGLPPVPGRKSGAGRMGGIDESAGALLGVRATTPNQHTPSPTRTSTSAVTTRAVRESLEPAIGITLRRGQALSFLPCLALLAGHRDRTASELRLADERHAESPVELAELGA